MRHSKRTTIVISLAILFVLFIPCLLVYLLSSQSFTKYISTTLDINNSEFIDICINYCSLSFSLLLGIVVYFQSQRINDLEITQYSTFLGVEDVDYSVDLGNRIFGQQAQSDFWVSHNFSSDRKVILAGVNLFRRGAAKSIVVPLVFITKNQPLIVSLHFQRVELQLMNRGTVICNQTLENVNSPIHSLLCNESRFVVGLGMLIPEDWIIDEISVKFIVELCDQNNHKENLMPIIHLRKFGPESRFNLISSQTIQNVK